MMRERASYPVWDPLVRILHWTLALSIALAWFTRTGFGRWHEWVGYASLVVIGVRLAWGAAGPPYARFVQFVRGPSAGLQYALLALRGRAPRYLGHNPLGGWMVLALITTTIAVGVTGWLYTTDAYWGEAWLETLHDACAKLLLALVALHVAGVIATSVLHRENLVRAMIHGRKFPPRQTDIA
jgi:cytochrome b